MGMQIPCGVHTETSEEVAVWAAAPGVGGGVSRIGRADGVSDRGGALDGRSRAHADLDTAEAIGVSGDGVHQGQECDSHRPGVCWETAELRGPAFLGAWVLGIDRYIREQEKEDLRLDQLELKSL